MSRERSRRAGSRRSARDEEGALADELRALISEQARLRGVAELVSRGAPPEEVFAAVANETSELVGEQVSLTRFEEEGIYSVLAVAGGGPVPIGTRVEYDPGCISDLVFRAGAAARIDDYDKVPGAVLAHKLNLVGSCGAPIIVEGRVWGILAAMSPTRALPAGTEQRLTQFADLVAASVANAATRAQLTASRARIVAAADESRRRLQRDVHDGAQQRLVHAVITLKLAAAALSERDDPTAELVRESLQHVERASSDLRDLVHGILPASLVRGGLRNGIESLAADCPLPVDIEVSAPRLATELETTAYFVVAEALTNVVKHARATHVRIHAALEDDALRIEVRDDGRGGVDSRRGSGITGLSDRIDAGRGTLTITSPPGHGTTLSASLPVPSAAAV
jgi:signal transduction histidine kinase